MRALIGAGLLVLMLVTAGPASADRRKTPEWLRNRERNQRVLQTTSPMMSVFMGQHRWGQMMNRAERRGYGEVRGRRARRGEIRRRNRRDWEDRWDRRNRDWRGRRFDD